MSQTVDQSPPPRKLIWIVGAMLWLLVPLGLYSLWRPGGESQHVEPMARPPVPAAWDPQGVEDFALTERSGRIVTKADLLGHPWAVCFIFTRCAGPCPKIVASMKELHDRLADTNVRFVTITVDPDYDTPEVLAKYADVVGADPDRWLFLTGDKEAVYRLILGSFLMPVREYAGSERKPGFEVLHSTNILHVDTAGRVVAKYDGSNDTDVVALRRALAADAD